MGMNGTEKRGKGLRGVCFALLGIILAGCLLWAPQTAAAEEPEALSKSGTGINAWMKYLPDDMQISQINMPGTHDTGMARPNLAYIPGTKGSKYRALYDLMLKVARQYCGGTISAVVDAMARTQTLYFQDQLEAGLRVFDIRLTLPRDETDPDSLILCHGFDFIQAMDKSSGISLTIGDCIEYSRAFLENNDTETVILMVCADSKDNNDTVRKHITKLLKSYEGTPDVLVYNPGDAVPTLRQARGKVVLVNSDAPVLNTYEMHYQYFPPKNISGTGKSVILKNILASAAIRKDTGMPWQQDYFLSRSKTPDKFQNLNKNYEKDDILAQIDAPNIIGTNLTHLDWDSDAIIQSIENIIKTLKDDARKIAKRLYKYISAYPEAYWVTGARYGWITMDDPPAWLTEKIIKTNYLDPAYSYNITLKDVPEDLAAYFEKGGTVQLAGFDEKIQMKRKSADSSEWYGQAIIHPYDVDKRYTDIAPVLKIFTGGSVYTTAVRVSQKFLALDPNDMANPGCWGMCSETYTVKEKGADTVTVDVPRIMWIDDWKAGRPKDMEAYTHEIGGLIFRRTWYDQAEKCRKSELYTLVNTDPDHFFYVEKNKFKKMSLYDSKIPIDYWYDIEAHLPKFAEYPDSVYEYEFLGVDSGGQSAYLVDYGPTPDPKREEWTINMTQKPRFDQIDGPTIKFIDKGVNHGDAIYQLFHEGFTHTGYDKNGDSISEQIIGVDNVTIRQVDENTYKTYIYARIAFPDNRVITKHEFTLPETLGEKQEAPNPRNKTYYELETDFRYYLTVPLAVDVTWDDKNDQYKLRPDSVTVGIGEYGTDPYVMEEITKPSDDNLWKYKTYVRPYEENKDGTIAGLSLDTENLWASSLNGYDVALSSLYDTPAYGIQLSVKYALDNPDYETVKGRVYWNDGDLHTSHDPKNTKIKVLQDGTVMDTDALGISLNVSGTGAQAYQFTPISKFPIWREYPDTQYIYSVEPVEMNGYTVTTRGRDIFYTRLVTVSGKVDWENGKRPANTQPLVALVRNGEQVAIQECEDFAYSFDGLPIASEDGVPYSYSIQAIMVEQEFDYIVTYSKPERSGSTGNVTEDATLHPVTEPLEVRIPLKLDLKTPAGAPSIIEEACFSFVMVPAGGGVDGQFLNLDNGNNFEGEFYLPDLPDYNRTYAFEVYQTDIGVLPCWQYDETVGTVNVRVRYINGKPVAEVDMEPDKSGKLSFTNVFALEKADADVQVEWIIPDGMGVSAPDSVTLTLVDDLGQKTRKKFTEKNGWAGTFDDLPLYRITKEGLEPVSYTLEAPDFDPYACEVIGSVETGFTVTYMLKYVPPTGDKNRPGALLSLMLLTLAAGAFLMKGKRRPGF